MACAELRSKHPLGKAIVSCYRAAGRKELAPPQDFQMLLGRDVQAVTAEKKVVAGNDTLFVQQKISLSSEMKNEAEIFLKDGCTVIYVSIDRQAAGFLVLSDVLRPDAPKMIEQIKQTGAVPVLLTGDHENAAQYYSRIRT